MTKTILRRLAYLLFFCLWLAVMLLPCLAFALAARGELSWQRGPHDLDRLWLIQEHDQKGIGYQAERVISAAADVNGSICVRDTVRFFLWEGSTEGQSIEYCECYSANGSASTANCP
ncbi:MAG TPA: hypothetical protein VI547_09275 [Anaerolineales bacterium]|nr:hypothetical protein [Anaerolineales bacterium]